jgi:aromatic-L-amino-acid decarboxylase
MVDPAALELSPDQMRLMTDAVVSRVLAHLASLDTQPVCGDLRVEGLCEAMKEPAPEHGTPLEPLLDALFDEWIPRSFTAPSPGYFAYIPGGGLYPAALADYIASATNRFTGIWQAAPSLVQLEANSLEWLRDWMQFPPTARGLYTTGGSMSNFNAIVCAREQHLGPDIRPGVLYATSQAHHCVVKSARLAGIMPDRLRTLPVDSGLRMRVDALSDAIAVDRRQGLHPFLVVSSAGTTNTGAVDPIDAIADVCAREGLWHHVDGAYGAFFHAVPELRPLLSGLSRADSLTLDPHKGLFLPYGTGALLVRDGAALHRAHAMPTAAGYLPPRVNPEEFYDPSEYGPDLSRDFPGLRVWLTVKLYGAARLRAAIAEKRALALDAASRMSTIPGLVILSPPELSLFAFYLTWPGATREDENVATQELLLRVRDRGRVFLTGCWVDDRFLGRVCILSFRTRQDRIDDCVQHVSEEAQKLVRSPGHR